MNLHPNSPHFVEPTDEQLSWELSILRKEFPISECDDCKFFHPESEHPCEVLDSRNVHVDQDECVALPRLIEDAQNAIVDGGLPNSAGWVA